MQLGHGRRCLEPLPPVLRTHQLGQALQSRQQAHDHVLRDRDSADAGAIGQHHVALSKNVQRPAIYACGGARHPLEVGAGPEYAVDVGQPEVHPHHLGARHGGNTGVGVAVPGDFRVGGKAREHGPQALGQNNLHLPIVAASEAAFCKTGPNPSLCPLTATQSGRTSVKVSILRFLSGPALRPRFELRPEQRPRGRATSR